MIRLFCALAAAMLLAATTHAPARADDGVSYERWSGPIIQQVEILSPPQVADLERRIADLERGTGRHLAIVVLNDLRGFAIEDYAGFLEEAWTASEADKARSVILVVYPYGELETIVVGRDLAGVVGEGVGAELLDAVHRKMTGEGLVGRSDDPGAVLAGVDAALRHLSLPDDEARRLSQAADERMQARAAKAEETSGLVLGIGAVFLMMLIGCGIWLNRIEAHLPPHLRRKQKVGFRWGAY